MALNRSEVRRLHLSDLAQVHHQQPGQEWVPHWHEEWSFGAVVAGQCRCSVAGRPFVARAGDLIVIRPDVVHVGALTDLAHTGAVHLVMLYVPAPYLARWNLVGPERSGVMPSPELASAAARMASADDVRAWLRRAVPLLADGLPPNGGAVDPIPTKAVRVLIEAVRSAVLGGEQTVSGLARHCAVSRERVHRVLKQWLGMAPQEYLRAVRLLRARQLVMSGESVAAVAAECGFSDQAHFTRWFRRTLGYTPGDLMRAMSLEAEHDQAASLKSTERPCLDRTGRQPY